MVSIRELATGNILRLFTTPITRTTFQRSNAGSMDTDLVCGVHWGFVPGGLIMAACGSDFPGRWSFDAETGEARPVAGLVINNNIGTGSNCATVFDSSADVPFIVSGGNSNHWHLGNGAIYDLRNSRSIAFSGCKHFSQGLTHAGTQAAYRLDDLARTDPTRAGFRLWGIQAAIGGVGCEVPGWLPLNTMGHDGSCKPKPAIMLHDGRVAVLCSKARLAATTSGAISANDYSETRLAIVHPKPNGKTGMIVGFTSWKSLDYTLSEPFNALRAYETHPQIAANGDTVIVFQPPSDFLAGSLKTIDSITGRPSAPVAIPKISEAYRDYRLDNFPQFGNVSLCLHGGMIHLLEFNGTVLLVRRYGMDCVYSNTIEIDVGTTADAGFHTVHSVQSTNAGILVSLLYRQNGKTRQSLVMLDAKPVEPVTPVIPTPEQEVLDFAKPRLSVEKYNAIYEVLR